MLSNSCKYAIRAVSFLAQFKSKSIKRSPKKISDELLMPTPYLAKILRELSKQKIISSAKGPGGGYFVSDENRTKTMLDIIISIDGLEKFKICFLGLPNCCDECPCSVHETVSIFKKEFLKNAKSKTINDLGLDSKKGEVFLV